MENKSKKKRKSEKKKQMTAMLACFPAQTFVGHAQTRNGSHVPLPSDCLEVICAVAMALSPRRCGICTEHEWDYGGCGPPQFASDLTDV